TMDGATNLKREGRSVARLSQTNLSTSRLSCQITLLDNNVSRPLQLVWQPFDQKFSFNFAIVSPSIVPFHKLDILNAICSVSRFSLGETSGSITPRVDFGALAETPLLYATAFRLLTSHQGLLRPCGVDRWSYCMSTRHMQLIVDQRDRAIVLFN